MKISFLFIILLILTSANAQRLPISGIVSDSVSGERLIGATVYCKIQHTGTVTDADGKFTLELTLPCLIEIRYLGYTTKLYTVEEQYLHIVLKPHENNLKEVTISSRPAHAAKQNQTGNLYLNAKEMANLPTIGGERDLTKAMQLMPGVQTTNQASSALLVRGGDADQTLYLLDGAPVYNPTHVLGFFSVFNSAVVSEVQLQKGGFDALYHDRISGVLAVKTKHVNTQRTSSQVALGLLASNISLQTPLIKEKLALGIAFRKAYLDQIMRMTPNRIPATFYDMNIKLSYELSTDRRINISVYNGSDRMYADPQSKVTSANDVKLDYETHYGNRLIIADYIQMHTTKTYSKWMAYYSSYTYLVVNTLQSSKMKLTSGIQDIGAAYTQNHTRDQIRLSWGADMSYRYFAPSVIKTTGLFSELLSPGTSRGAVQYLTGAYVSTEWKPFYRHTIDIGMRVMAVHTFHWQSGVEPRIKYAYALNDVSAITATYSLMRQYIHLLGSNNVSLPSDTWYPSTRHVKPQESRQYTLGYHLHYAPWSADVSIETFYKDLRNLSDYREGSSMLVHSQTETEIILGNGNAYGVELLLKAKKGKVNGWFSYTLSYATRQFEELNDGKTFYARYDRRHVANIHLQFVQSSRVTWSAVWTISSGSRFTPVVGKYLMPVDNLSNIEVLPIYGKLNSLVLAPQHRLDINLIILNKPKARYRSEWHVGAYNVYNRVQPYKITSVVDQNGVARYYQTGLFGFLPSIAYQLYF